jgi:hypothetical protein
VLPLEMMPVKRSMFSWQLQPPHFLDVAVDAGCLVGAYGLYLAFAKEPALCVDLFRRQDVPLERGLRHHGERPGEERHVRCHVGLVRNAALDLGRRDRRIHQRGSEVAGSGACRRSPDGNAQPAQEFSARDIRYFRHSVKPCHDFVPLGIA